MVEVSKEIELGSEAGVVLSFKDSKAVLSGMVDSKGADLKVELSVDVDYLIDKICEKIPGPIDNTLGDLLKAGLKA